MHWNGFLSEKGKAVLLIPPQTQNGAGLTSLWFYMARYRRLSIYVCIGNRAGATTPNITLNQAKDAAGTGSKGLSFDTYWRSTNQSQTNDDFVIGAAASDAVPLNATDNSVDVIEIRDDMLDINNDFGWVQVAIATPGANDVPVCVLGIGYDADHETKASLLPSAVAA